MFQEEEIPVGLNWCEELQNTTVRLASLLPDDAGTERLPLLSAQKCRSKVTSGSNLYYLVVYTTIFSC